MAATVTWEDLRALASFRAVKGCVVSLYLNLDPHVVPTAGETHTRINSLLDEATKHAESNRSELTHDQHVALRASEHVLLAASLPSGRSAWEWSTLPPPAAARAH